MRNSLKKLRGLTQRKGDYRDKKERRQQSAPQLDELARATQDMIDMRDCYDSLLSAAAATTNSAYEFSESLKEMGACLLEKTALNDDEESGRVLIRLGKLQFEIQKLLDNYRSHIFQTITKPAESLLNELRVVEDMKRQCDDKRKLYEEMIPKHREKGRSRGSKGESVSSQQLKAAHDNYDEEATLFVFRLKSLKQGQSRSLLTQAARHHAAQLCFFRKALNSLETVEPDVKLVTAHHHIDYHFSGLEDDNVDSGDNDESDFSESESSSYGDGELSFDYGQDDQGQNVVSTQRDSMEIDQPDLTFPQVVTADAVKEHAYRNPAGDSFLLSKGMKTISQSAPLSAESKFDPADRFRQMQPLLSSRKYHTYVLPTPIEPKRPVSPVLDAQTSQTRRASVSGATFNYRHSSPFLAPRRQETITRNEYLSGPILSSQPPVLRESNNNNNASVPFLRPLAEEISPRYTSDTKKIKRHAFSGPLTGKTLSNKTGGLSSNNPMVSTGGLPPKIFSGPLLRTPVSRSSPKVSPSTSPTFVSSPQISELHELPRPPAAKPSASLVGWPSNEVGYSGPLVSRVQEVTATNQVGYSGPLVTRGQALGNVNQVANVAASPLPVPPAVPRSHSIPSSGQRGSSAPYAPTPLGAPRVLKTGEDIASPPLTPISLPLIQPAPDVS